MSKYFRMKRSRLHATDDLEGRVGLLQDALLVLRIDVRRLAAVRNAEPTRWFGGSLALQQHCFEGLLGRVLSDIRAMMMGNKTDVALVPVVLAVAVDALRTAGVKQNILEKWLSHSIQDGWEPLEAAMEPLGPSATVDEEWLRPTPVGAARRAVAGLRAAEVLQTKPETQHLVELANKLVAHRNPVGLRDGAGFGVGMQNDQYSFRLIAECVEAMSLIFQRHVNPNLVSMDATVASPDAFLRQVPEEGLPAIDYKMAEALRSPDYLMHGGDFVVVRKEAWERVISERTGELAEDIARADAEWLAMAGKGLDPEVLVERWGWPLTPALETYLMFQRG